MDTENITSPELVDLEQYKFAKNIYGSQDLRLYDADPDTGPFTMDNRVTECNRDYLDYLKDATFKETIELTGKHQYDLYPIYPNVVEDRKYIFKNIRFKNASDARKVKYYEVTCGGQRFDRVRDCFSDALCTFHEMDGIPLYMFKHGAMSHIYHRTNIILHPQDDDDPSEITLLVDKYELNHLNQPDDSVLEYQTYQNYQNHDTAQNTLTPNGDGVFHTHMDPIHPIYFIICNQRIYDIELHINGTGFKLTQDKNGIINLTNHLKADDFSRYCINASLVDMGLTYKIEDDRTTGDNLVFSYVTSQIVRICSGMTVTGFN